MDSCYILRVEHKSLRDENHTKNAPTVEDHNHGSERTQTSQSWTGASILRAVNESVG